MFAKAFEPKDTEAQLAERLGLALGDPAMVKIDHERWTIYLGEPVWRTAKSTFANTAGPSTPTAAPSSTPWPCTPTTSRGGGSNPPSLPRGPAGVRPDTQRVGRFHVPRIDRDCLRRHS